MNDLTAGKGFEGMTGMSSDEWLRSCACSLVEAGLKFQMANYETGYQLTNEQIVAAITSELMDTASVQANEAKTYREAYQQIEDFLAVFAEAVQETPRAVPLRDSACT